MDSMHSYGSLTFIPATIDVWQDFQNLIIAFVIIGFLDLTCQVLGWFPESKSNTRYFSLHVIVNAFVTYVHFKDVVATYQDPPNAAFGPCDTRGSIAIMALHLYHIVFFRPLDWIDWVHHGVMVLVMLPLAYALVPGHLLGHGSFFASGLPGGLDYLMLVCVKKGWLKSIQEKSINRYIQLWIRAPGCVFHAVLTWIAYLQTFKRAELGLPLQQPLLPLFMVNFAIAVVAVTFYWNGLFFLDRVIDSHTRHTIRDAAKDSQGKKAE